MWSSGGESASWNFGKTEKVRDSFGDPPCGSARRVRRKCKSSRDRHLTPSLVVPKNTCVETRALECPPARRAGIHTRCRNPKKKKNRPLLGHTHDDKERSELLL
mgnify:CR=1 FL=1